MSQAAPVIHLVDDDESFRTAVTRLLRASGFEVRGYPTAGDFLLARTGDRPGCVVLDVRMPGPSGLHLQEALLDRPEAPPVIFLTGHGDIPTTVHAMKAGAVDFLTKPVQRDQLLTAVRNALARDADNRKSRERAGVVRARYEKLTPRQRAVFDLVVQGKLNKQIATELGISERTIKAHRAEVMERMQADSVAELVRSAQHLEGAGCMG